MCFGKRSVQDGEDDEMHARRSSCEGESHLGTDFISHCCAQKTGCVGTQRASFSANLHSRYLAGTTTARPGFA